MGKLGGTLKQIGSGFALNVHGHLLLLGRFCRSFLSVLVILWPKPAVAVFEDATWLQLLFMPRKRSRSCSQL